MAHAAPATRRDDPPAVDVAANLAAVTAEVQDAARAAGRAPGEITLIAVSKGHPASRILPALAAGHTTYGENRVQEASEKWQTLRTEWPGAALHYIGALQTNKVRDAVAIADAIHAIDRPKLAAALAREMERQGRRPDCFIQVNTGAEPQKAGSLAGWPRCAGRAVPGRSDAARDRAHVHPARRRGSHLPHFTLLRELAARHGLDRLSMGMSADYRTAIALGATHVRIGTAIFGARPTRLIPAGRHSSGRNAEPGPTSPRRPGSSTDRPPPARRTLRSAHSPVAPHEGTPRCPSPEPRAHRCGLV